MHFCWQVKCLSPQVTLGNQALRDMQPLAHSFATDAMPKPLMAPQQLASACGNTVQTALLCPALPVTEFKLPTLSIYQLLQSRTQVANPSCIVSCKKRLMLV
jgi:hypothetical protein